MMMHRQALGIEVRHPANWSAAAQALACLAVFLLILLSGWQLCLDPALTLLYKRQQEERALKDAYQTKIKTVANLPMLRDHLQALRMQQRHLAAAENGNSMLEDIAAAAQAHGLILELARPGGTQAMADYSAHALGIRLRGRYHDLGRFAADIAAMPRIVVLGDLKLSAADDGMVAMEAVALGYRQREIDDHARRGDKLPPGGRQ